MGCLFDEAYAIDEKAKYRFNILSQCLIKSPPAAFPIFTRG
jgi:hypothetical protein